MSPGRRGPVVVATRADLDAALASYRLAGVPVALVATMGALHAGHASLVREARTRVGDGAVVVSIFVNPTQFAPGEDLERYPRTIEADLAVCAREGADVVFVPTLEEVYPGGLAPAGGLVTVDPGPLGGVLEGAVRPTHFRGVLSVVARLLGLVRPEIGVFGEKDFQQLVLVRRMTADLCLRTEVVGAPTVREDDGLAMSSRNAFLRPEQRRQAVALHRALRAAADAAAYGVGPAREAALAVLHEATGVELDYLVLTADDLGELPAEPVPGTLARALVAARVGRTRLIDNVALSLGAPATAGAAQTVSPRPGDSLLG